MTIQEYVDQLNRRFKTGLSREHSYRGDLQSLLGSLLPNLLVTNEPSRTDVGAPDYILTKGNIPVGYIEAKDIGDPDLEGKKKNKEQYERYKSGFTNEGLIFTDYLRFRFYREGDFVTSIRIAEINDDQYFGNVPKKAWEFYIGGYQPAEKWLKDRRDRELSFDEIRHYQKIVVALMETDRIMGEIDEVGVVSM